MFYKLILFWEGKINRRLNAERKGEHHGHQVPRLRNENRQTLCDTRESFLQGAGKYAPHFRMEEPVALVSTSAQQTDLHAQRSKARIVHTCSALLPVKIGPNNKFVDHSMTTWRGGSMSLLLFKKKYATAMFHWKMLNQSMWHTCSTNIYLACF
jgi:hypothetical protein